MTNYIDSYAKDNWHDDRLVHAPTKIKQLEQQARDLEWEGKDATKLRIEISQMKAYLETSGSEFYPLF